MKHFDYKTLEEIRQAAEEAGARRVRFVDSPAEVRAALAQPVFVGGARVGNSIAIHPMEGCDGDADGRPSELTWRRYERFARGGAKLDLVRGHRGPPRGPRQPAAAMDPSGQRNRNRAPARPHAQGAPPGVGLATTTC